MECWTDDKILKLVRLYSRFPNLWDRNEPSYDDLPSRYYSYSQILQGLCMPEHVTVSDVLSQLRKLRKIYVSELRRMDVDLKSGRICQPGVAWFEVMHCFLYDHLDADERLARSSDISIHSRGSSSHSWTTCSSQGASQCCEREERAEIFQENSSDQRRAQKGHIFFLRAPTVLPLARMNTVYEITKRKGTNLDGEKKSDDNSKCIQCNTFYEEPNLQGKKKRRYAASPGTLCIRCKDKIRADNFDKDRLSYRGSRSKDDGRPYHEISRTVCRNEGPSKCGPCQEREKDIRMNKVIEDCISAARKSLSNIRQQRPELDEHLISRTMQKKDSFNGDVQCSSCVSRSRNEDIENLKSPKEVTKIICLGDQIKDDMSTILNDKTIKLCPIDIKCNSDASKWSSCNSCSEPTKSVKVPIFSKKGNADGLQEVLETARIELQDAGTLYNDSKFVRASRDGLEVAEEINKEYDWFGTEVATALKKTDRQRAIKLKELILETLQTAKFKEVDNPSQLKKIEGACTKDKWTDRKLLKLVSLYRKYPCLWQKDAKAYLDNRARHCAYRSIHNAMSPLECSFIEVMMKIRELRRMYVLELKKCLQAETANCYYDSDCTWFHILHEFLYPYLDYDEAAELQDIPRILSSSNIQRCYKKRNDDKDSPNSSNARPEWEVPKNTTAGNLKQSPTRIIECKSKKQEVHDTLRCCDSIESRKSIPLTILYDKKSEYCSKEGSSATDQEVSWTTESTCKKPNLSAVRKQSADEAKFKPRIEAEDEFDIFSRSVACQLKKMDRNAALKAQMEIQKILTERLIGPQTATETVITASKILAPSNVDSERYVNPPYSIVKRNQNERTSKNVSNPVSTFKRTAAQLQQSLVRRSAGPNRSERIGTKRGPISPVVKTRRDGK